MMITGSICRAARALVEIGRPDLATIAKVDAAVIEAFEHRADTPDDATIAALQAALERLGAIFIPEDEALGAGVRLKFSRGVTKRVDILENEGGIAGTDDVP